MARLSDVTRRGVPLLIRFAKFAAVGLSGVGVNTMSLYMLHERASLPLLVAAPLAVEASIASNFLLNNRWTFGKSTLALAGFAKFNLISLGGLAIATASLYALVTTSGFYYLMANLVGIGLATAWNFALNLVWTWRQA